METIEKTKLTSVLYVVNKMSKIACFLLEQEEDLRTEIHSKIIPFWIINAAGILVTDKEVTHNGDLYRVIETDAFRLVRKYENDLMVSFSVGQGKTRSLLLIRSELVTKISEASNGIDFQDIKVAVSKLQLEVLTSITMPTAMNEMSGHGIDRDTFESDKSGALLKLQSVGLDWSNYETFHNYRSRYLINEMSWLEEKKFEMMYSL